MKRLILRTQWPLTLVFGMAVSATSHAYQYQVLVDHKTPGNAIVRVCPNNEKSEKSFELGSVIHTDCNDPLKHDCVVKTEPPFPFFEEETQCTEYSGVKFGDKLQIVDNQNGQMVSIKELNLAGDGKSYPLIGPFYDRKDGSLKYHIRICNTEADRERGGTGPAFQFNARYTIRPAGGALPPAANQFFKGRTDSAGCLDTTISGYGPGDFVNIGVEKFDGHGEEGYTISLPFAPSRSANDQKNLDARAAKDAGLRAHSAKTANIVLRNSLPASQRNNRKAD